MALISLFRYNDLCTVSLMDGWLDRCFSVSNQIAELSKTIKMLSELFSFTTEGLLQSVKCYIFLMRFTFHTICSPESGDRESNTSLSPFAPERDGVAQRFMIKFISTFDELDKLWPGGERITEWVRSQKDSFISLCAGRDGRDAEERHNQGEAETRVGRHRMVNKLTCCFDCVTSFFATSPHCRLVFSSLNYTEIHPNWQICQIQTSTAQKHKDANK